VKGQQYLSEGKLFALGFTKRKNWFILERKKWDKMAHRLTQKEIGRVRLDEKGFVLESRGFERMNGNLVFAQTPAFM